MDVKKWFSDWWLFIALMFIVSIAVWLHRTYGGVLMEIP